MSDSSSSSPFGPLLPGFEFLQGLVRNAGAALPGVGQWVTPTLNPEELDKRIQELRTVQYWLEQNARMLATTIQALEVQRLTLSTLQQMNVSMGDLRDALSVPRAGAPDAAEPPPRAASPSPNPAPVADTPPAPPPEPPSASSSGAEADASARPAPVIDPMRWWGTLTEQFTQVATQALRDHPAAAAPAPAKAGKRAATPAAKKAPAAQKAKAPLRSGTAPLAKVAAKAAAKAAASSTRTRRAPPKP